MPIRDRDVHVRRKVASVQFWRKVLEHVQCVRVDVQFVAERNQRSFSISIPPRNEQNIRSVCQKYALADGHHVVWKLCDEFVGLRERMMHVMR